MSTEPPRRRARAKPGDGLHLRGDILLAAEELLVAGGGEAAVTMRAVAARVGVTTPSVYLHFPDKPTLITAVCLRVWSRLIDQLRDAWAEVEDPYEALATGARAYVRFGLDHPLQYRLLLMRPPGSPHGVAETDAAQSCLDGVTALAERAVANGTLRGDPTELANQMWVTVHGLVSMLISSPPFPMPDSVDEFIAKTLRSAGIGMAIASRLRTGSIVAGQRLTAVADDCADRLAGADRE